MAFLKIVFSLLTFQFAFSYVTAQSTILWSDVEGHRIVSTSLEDGNHTLIHGPYSPTSLVYDSLDQKIYWADAERDAIIAINRDGSQQETIITGIIDPKGISLTKDQDIVFITDHKIVKYDKNGNYLGVIQNNIDNPLDVEISGDFIYWSDAEESVIERSKLDGTSRKVVVSEAYYASDIMIDLDSNNLYWVQRTGAIPYSGIYTSKLNGSNKKPLIEEFVSGIALDVENQYIYWSESIYNTIHRTNLNDISEDEHLIDRYLPNPRDLVLDKGNNKIYFINFESGNFLYSANLSNGSSVKKLAGNIMYRPTRFALDTLNGKLYWINSPSSVASDNNADIVRSNLDGTETEILISYPDLERPYGLELDVENNYMYWTDEVDGTINRASLDGTNDTILVNQGVQHARGIELDKMNGKIYWTDWGQDAIKRANFDGSELEEVIAAPSIPTCVKVSNVQSKIYWSEKASGLILRSNMNGSQIDTVHRTEEPPFTEPNAIHLDEESGKIYFTITGSQEKIQRCNFDGSDVETIIENNLGSPHDILFLPSPLISNTSHKVIADTRSKIYPNPFQNSLSIDSENIIKTLTIFDRAGKQIFEKDDINASFLRIRDIQVNPGLYFVRIRYDNGQASTISIIKGK